VPPPLEVAPAHQLKLAESRHERRIRFILDLLIDMKASLSAVERDSFKAVMDEFGV